MVSRSRKAEAGTVAGAPPRHGYHHGSLPAALVDAAEALLAERGLDGFSLREVARRLGVSPAAPSHHFGDAQGLLAAVATLAFEGLTAALEAGNQRGGADPVARLREQGVGYVGFALRHPGRFGLMFRTALAEDAARDERAREAFMVLERGVRALAGAESTAALTPAQWSALLAVWSVVHGFAHLALAGQMRPFGAGPQPAHGGSAGGSADDPDTVLLRQVLAPMLQLQLEALRSALAPRGAPRRATSGSR